ncbi:MAG TPA: CHRD domain-containing protein [Candidatus Kapabacteria bacterium]|nr:CHRD domain-containing protein [Candidatus Kapabacteria bacterium]
MISHSQCGVYAHPRLLTLGILATLLAASAAAGLSAQEAFPATHIIVASSRTFVPDSARGVGVGFMNVDQVAGSEQFRITLLHGSSPISQIFARKHTLDGSDPTLQAFFFPDGVTTVTTTLNAFNVEAFNALDSNLLYLDIRTEAYPDSFMVGMAYAIPSAATYEFDGRNVVPPNSGAGGSGSGYLIYDPATRSARYIVNWSDLGGDVTGVKIRRGTAGTNGPKALALPLSAGSSMCVGMWTGMSDTDIAAMKHGALYITVNTASHPDGEIRGQLIPVDMFAASLEPANEVPPQSGTLASGTAYMALGSFADGSYTLAVIGAYGDITDSVTAAGLYLGAPGNIGPLLETVENDEPHHLEFSKDIASGEITADQVTAIRSGNSYLNVYSPAYGGGEIRGQFVPAGTNFFLSETPREHPAATSEFTAQIDRNGTMVHFTLPESLAGTGAHIVLYDMLGRAIVQVPADTRFVSVATDGLASGVYVAQATRGSAAPAVARFVVAR